MNNRHLIVIIVVTFIVIVIWIVADILHTRPSIPLSPKLETLLTPISPNFDQKVISQIKEIKPISEEENVASTPVAIPLPAIKPLTIDATQSATSGGALP